MQTSTRLLYKYYDAQVDLSQMLDEARSLKTQVTQGGEGGSKTNTLAIILLKIRALAGLQQIPTNLQINLGGAGDTASTQADQIADLDALTHALEDRIKSIDADILRLTSSLSDNSGANAVLTAQRLSDSQQVSLTAELNQLLTLNGLDGLRAITSTEDSLSRVIAGYNQQLNQAQAKFEEQLAHKQDLTQRRDVERDAYIALLSKQTEVQVSDALTGSEVRFASEAIVPDQRVTSRVIYVAAGGVAGFVIACLIALALATNGKKPTTGNGKTLWVRINQWVFARI